VLLSGLSIALGEQRAVAGGIDDGLPLAGENAGKIEHQVVVDVEEAGHVFRALDVARHPVDGVGHAAQQRLGWRDHDWPPGASTQVSLLPPPCDELTTSEPFFMATRVSPPGRTEISLPQST